MCVRSGGRRCKIGYRRWCGYVWKQWPLLCDGLLLLEYHSLITLFLPFIPNLSPHIIILPYRSPLSGGTSHYLLSTATVLFTAHQLSLSLSIFPVSSLDWPISWPLSPHLNSHDFDGLNSFESLAISWTVDSPSSPELSFPTLSWIKTCMDTSSDWHPIQYHNSNAMS